MDERLVSVSLEEAAELLRPRMEIGHYEYILSEEHSIAFALTVREIILDGGLPDAAGGSPLDSEEPPPSAAQPLRPNVILDDEWYKANGVADDSPYERVATFVDWVSTPAVSCTAFKMTNHYTAVTNAHCIYDLDTSSWKQRKELQFAAGSDSPGGSGNAKNVLDAQCYARAYPGCYSASACDYAVLALRGRGGAWCNSSEYNVGYFGYVSTGGAGTFATRMASYPSVPPDSHVFPSMYYSPQRSDAYVVGDNLLHFMDELPGVSGSPIYRTNDNGQVRAIQEGSCEDSTCNAGVRMQTSVISYVAANAGY